MSARRLNDSEKQEIIALYRQAGETTISLADRFGVSNSTIGRVVKNGMENAEYDALVQQKRGRSVEVVEPEVVEPEVVEPEVVEPEAVAEPVAAPAVLASAKPKPRIAPKVVLGPKVVLPPIVAPQSGDEDDYDDDLDDDDDFDGEDEPADPTYLELAAELGGVTVAVDDDDDDDFEEDDDFGEEDDDDDEDDGTPLPRLQIEARDQLTVLPLADAAIPKVFYLVVDRGAELIAPPLRDFGELGEMSSAEAENRTLPLFDNHRVAKRFSNVRTQRVIKVPDNRLFYKTTRHLSAKGIKRFLLDGQVYTLV
jgi:transposase-like protein